MLELFKLLVVGLPLLDFIADLLEICVTLLELLDVAQTTTTRFSANDTVVSSATMSVNHHRFWFFAHLTFLQNLVVDFNYNN